MRRALIRWLGGHVEPKAQPAQPPQPSQPSAQPFPGPAAFPASAPPPSLDRGQLLHQSERYFAYAELLSQQGSGDLAAPVYRQAYLGLRALVGVSGVSAPALQPALPPSRNLTPQPAAAVPRPSAAPFGTTSAAAAFPRPAPAVTAPTLEQQLAPLREGLNTSTAADVERRLLALLQQGHRHEDLTNLLGLALLLQDRRDEAERWFRETLTLNPSHSRALVNLGGLYLSANRPEEAVQLLSRAVELIDPRSSEILAALTNLCLAQQQLGRPMDAAQLALRIFRLKPDHLRPESLAAAAGILEQMGEEDGAIEVLHHLRTLGANADLTRRLAQLLERRGDFQGAALVYRDLLATPEAATSPS